MCSWQVWLHGGQLRPQTKRGVRVPHHNGGSPKRDAGPRHLPYQVQVHRWRQKRSPVLGMEPRYQEGLEGLIFFWFFFPPSHTRSLVHQCLPLLCFRFSFFLAIIPTSPWILDCFSLLLSPSISLLTPLLRFHLFSFSSKFQSLHHSSHSNADWFLFAPAFITRMTS